MKKNIDKLFGRIKKCNNTKICSYMKEEYDFEKLITTLCLLFGLIVLFYGTFLQTVYVENLHHILDSLSEDKKREILFGDFYKYIENATLQIPEKDNIIILNHDLFVGYYLYPRKIYYSNSLENISEEWVDKKGIKWVLLYNPEKFNLSDAKIIKIR